MSVGAVLQPCPFPQCCKVRNEGPPLAPPKGFTFFGGGVGADRNHPVLPPPPPNIYTKSILVPI